MLPPEKRNAPEPDNPEAFLKQAPVLATGALYQEHYQDRTSVTTIGPAARFTPGDITVRGDGRSLPRPSTVGCNKARKRRRLTVGRGI